MNLKPPSNESVDDWYHQWNRFGSEYASPCAVIGCPYYKSCEERSCLENLGLAGYLPKVAKFMEILNETT